MLLEPCTQRHRPESSSLSKSMLKPLHSSVAVSGLHTRRHGGHHGSRHGNGGRYRYV